MKIATTNAATIKRPRTITPADKGVPPPGQLTGVYDDIQNTTRPPPYRPLPSTSRASTGSVTMP